MLAHSIEHMETLYMGTLLHMHVPLQKCYMDRPVPHHFGILYSLGHSLLERCHTDAVAVNADTVLYGLYGPKWSQCALHRFVVCEGRGWKLQGWCVWTCSQRGPR